MIFTHSIYSFCVSGTIIGAKDRTVNKVIKALLSLASNGGEGWWTGWV